MLFFWFLYLYVMYNMSITAQLTLDKEPGQHSEDVESEVKL